jgi:hypothetical protein
MIFLVGRLSGLGGWPANPSILTVASQLHDPAIKHNKQNSDSTNPNKLHTLIHEILNFQYDLLIELLC